LVFGFHAQASIPTPVFVLHAYSQEYPWSKGQHQGFVQALNEDASRAYALNVEYLDTKRAGYSPAYADLIVDHLRQKYKGYQPAAVYVTDDNALSFALSHLDRVFPGVPVFFSGINNYDVGPLLDSARTTGVFEKKEIAPNLRLMRRIDPAIKEIVIVATRPAYRAIESDSRGATAPRRHSRQLLSITDRRPDRAFAGAQGTFRVSDHPGCRDRSRWPHAHASRNDRSHRECRQIRRVQHGRRLSLPRRARRLRHQRPAPGALRRSFSSGI
jgi:hypothetical protein